MEVLGGNLVSYKEVISFLKKKGKGKGKGKNFFNTLRTRHSLIHAPIIKPPESFSIKEMGVKFRRGRSVYYLQEIIPFLGEIIRLLDEEHLTFKQMEKEMRSSKLQLDELRKLELTDDTHVKSTEFIKQYEIAKIKLGEYFEWVDSDAERQFLDCISRKRNYHGKLYYRATKILAEATLKRDKDDYDGITAEREYFGRRLEFCHQIMEAVINQFKDLLHKRKIEMTANDWKEVVDGIDNS